ncbi:MAG: hypothetical protein OXD40_05060 [bacterium]|nr:hypothetical protein [bacterium]
MERKTASHAGDEVDGGGKSSLRESWSHERDRIDAQVFRRRMTTAELMYAAAVATAGERPAVAGSNGRLTRQIERMSRYTRILATALCDEMLANGRGEEMEEFRFARVRREP